MKADKKQKWVAPSARIANLLRERVASLKPGEPFGTEVAIADECGVSRMTARKAVNALVEEGLVERRAGVGIFVRGKDEVTRRWRFIAGNLLWDSAIKAASGARREAQKIGAELELKDAGGDMRALLAEIAALPDSGATGAIVFSVHAKAFDAAVHAVAEKGFPIVVVDEDLGKKVNVSCVVADNVVGGRLAAERIVSAGHRRPRSAGSITGLITCSIRSALICGTSTLGSCCVEIRTVSILFTLSSSYSTVTWVLPSGLR